MPKRVEKSALEINFITFERLVWWCSWKLCFCFYKTSILKVGRGPPCRIGVFYPGIFCTGFCDVISATLKSTLNSKQAYISVRPQGYISGTSMNHLKMYLYCMYRYIRQRQRAIGIQNDCYPFLMEAHVWAHACTCSVFRLCSYMTVRRQRQYCKVGGPA